MSELRPEAYLPRGKVRRRVKKVPGDEFAEQFAMSEPEKEDRRKTLWCKNCGKFRPWKEIRFEYYLYKEAWWRKTICKVCNDILKDEALE